MITFTPFLFGCLVVVSVVLCKYFHSPKILVLAIFLSSYIYQKITDKENNIVNSFEGKVINISQFIIVSGIVGFVVVKILGFLLPGFD